MKANLLQIVLFICVWVLIPIAEGQNTGTMMSGLPSAAGEHCEHVFLNVFNVIMNHIVQLHEKMDKFETIILKNENRNEFLNIFVSRVKDQLDRESELQAQIDVLKLQLLEERKVKDTKTNISESKDNLQLKIESLENTKSLLEDQTLKPNSNLTEGKDILVHQINTNDSVNPVATELEALPSKILDEVILPSSCNRTEHPSGIHQIQLPETSHFFVQCENDIAGPGWTIIQKRFDGSVDFNQNWHNYSMGFGNLDGEFFLGLQKIHLLTYYEPHEFYAHLEYFDGTIKFEHCKSFKVGSELEHFVLHVKECTNGVHGILYHDGYKFLTKDRDNDVNCAATGGGWWFIGCGLINPNGKYYPQGGIHYDGMFWTNSYENLKSVQLLIRPNSLKAKHNNILT